MTFEGGAIMGLFLGFALGVGCALAVMFSIYMGGYRKAVEESLLAEKPKRFVRAAGKAATRGGREPE